MKVTLIAPGTYVNMKHKRDSIFVTMETSASTGSERKDKMDTSGFGDLKKPSPSLTRGDAARLPPRSLTAVM
ncbi:unnamed protein product [Arctogadus glacialis]